MKAARFVMRSAGSLSGASLVPREVEHFSRYSPSPLSMKQLLDFGELGCRALAGVLGRDLNFKPQCGEGWAHSLKLKGSPFLLSPEALTQAHLAFS